MRAIKFPGGTFSRAVADSTTPDYARGRAGSMRQQASRLPVCGDRCRLIAGAAWWDAVADRIAHNTRTVNYEVVLTDDSYWHSSGMAGISVFEYERAARRHLGRMKATRRPGQGAFMRKVPR